MLHVIIKPNNFDNKSSNTQNLNQQLAASVILGTFHLGISKPFNITQYKSTS